MATIPEPEISRNFRAIGGILQGRWLNPTPNSRPIYSGGSLGGHSRCPTEQPPARGAPTHGDPRIPRSLASSGPSCASQTPLTSLASDVHVKKHSGVTRVGGLSLGGRVRHCDLQTRLEADSGHLVSAESPKPKRGCVNGDLMVAPTSHFRRQVRKGQLGFRRRLHATPPRAGNCVRPVLCAVSSGSLFFLTQCSCSSHLSILFACVSPPVLPSWCRRAAEVAVPCPQPQVCREWACAPPKRSLLVWNAGRKVLPAEGRPKDERSKSLRTVLDTACW